MTKTLIVVHVATKTGAYPDGSPWSYSDANYEAMAIGSATEVGRIFHALQLYQMFGPGKAQLYITLPPNELPELGVKGFLNLHERAVNLVTHLRDVLEEAHGIDPELALWALSRALVDDWSDAAELKHPMNTGGEATRAVLHAVKNGFRFIQPVSTALHFPRCGWTDYAEAKKHGIIVCGYASAPFEGLEDDAPAIIDPPHVKGAPFAQMAVEHQLHTLIPAVFMTARADPDMYTDFAETAVVPWLLAHGRTTNAKGQPLLPPTET